MKCLFKEFIESNISYDDVRLLFKIGKGYPLFASVKMETGPLTVPLRDIKFLSFSSWEEVDHINEKIKSIINRGKPIVSVDEDLINQVTSPILVPISKVDLSDEDLIFRNIFKDTILEAAKEDNLPVYRLKHIEGEAKPFTILDGDKVISTYNTLEAAIVDICFGF